jgi:hypothetical protein
MKVSKRFIHIAYNLALSCFILGCIPKLLNIEGSNIIFTVGCSALVFGFILKAFDASNEPS